MKISQAGTISGDDLRAAQAQTREVRKREAPADDVFDRGEFDRRDQHPPGPTLVSAADLVAREFKPPKWAVPDLVPEGLSILAGKPKTGKSWLALDFAVAVAAGSAALGNVSCDQGVHPD